MMADESTGLLQELSQLRDLFSRRLLDDKVKARAIEALSNENRQLVDLLEHREFDGVARELILLLDRLEAQGANGDDEFLASVYDELLEILARRGVEQIAPPAEFDPGICHAVSTSPSSDGCPAGSVVSVVRKGYRSGERLLRPIEVVVSV